MRTRDLVDDREPESRVVPGARWIDPEEPLEDARQGGRRDAGPVVAHTHRATEPPCAGAASIQACPPGPGAASSAFATRLSRTRSSAARSPTIRSDVLLATASTVCPRAAPRPAKRPAASSISARASSSSTLSRPASSAGRRVSRDPRPSLPGASSRRRSSARRHGARPRHAPSRRGAPGRTPR